MPDGALLLRKTETYSRAHQYIWELSTPGTGVSMNKVLWTLRIDINYIDSESAALADSLKRNLGLMPRPSLNLILAIVEHGWVFLKGLAGVKAQRIQLLPRSREAWET